MNENQSQCLSPKTVGSAIYYCDKFEGHDGEHRWGFMPSGAEAEESKMAPLRERIALLEQLVRDSVVDMHRHRKWVIGYPAYGDAAMSVRLGRITEIDNFLEQARALGIVVEKEVA